MDAIIRKITCYLARNEAIAQEDADIYEYGLYILISDLIDFGITFLAAFLIGMVPHTLLYYIAFVGLRRVAGGYHASTRIGCFVISMIAWLISVLLIRLTASCIPLSVGYAFVSCLVIWLFAPVENSNNPITPEETVRMRRLSRIYVLVLAAVVGISAACVPLGVPDWVSSSLAYGMAFFAGSILVAKSLGHKAHA